MGLPAQAAANKPGQARLTFKYRTTTRNPPAGQQVAQAGEASMNQQAAPAQAVHIQGQEPLTSSMLAQVPPQEQKQMLGERLYPLIQVCSTLFCYSTLLIFRFQHI